MPKEKLLGFKAPDECESLCEFLAREVPEGPYPHRNDGKAANQLMKSFAVYGVGDLDCDRSLCMENCQTRV